ncbi:MAG: AAA family ATPase [Fibrobacter sp.]|uniref:AAA family ATPase n=1 Tax=Fibrobacter sp. TaxID=35828 RepID=UPI0025BEE31D|nr:AAA family ATPase [Fibrobacter sp.]MBQ9226839.1 AAA family ATPase [Fibrobacter sp.]
MLIRFEGNENDQNFHEKTPMELNIENFAKIKSAKIKLDGITAIAGLNDTGKSTVGKILYGMFSAIANIDKSVVLAKKRSIQQELNSLLHQNILNSHGSISQGAFRYPREFIDDLVVSENKTDALDAYLRNLEKRQKEFEITYNEDLKTQITESIRKVLSIPDEKVAQSVVSLAFQKIFNERINNIDNPDADAVVGLLVKNRNIELVFKDDSLESMRREISLVNSATYIDNPFVLDRLNQWNVYENREAPWVRDLTKKLISLNEMNRNKPIEDEALSRMIVSEGLQKILDELDEVAPGSIDNTHDGYLYRREKSGKALSVNSLSTGLKAFAIIKRLLLNQGLKERDVLILDEPEVHLHPKWQLKYAEIIVLLQKTFNLTVVVTTHSSHFLEALDLYSKIHKTSDVCSYYFASCIQDSDLVSFENVTGQLEKIYSNLVQPSFLIDEIKEKYGVE